MAKIQCKPLEKGQEINVGDYIGRRYNHNQAAGFQYGEVTRVTRCYAFVRVNQSKHGEIKYPRIYDGMFQSVPRDKFCNFTYNVMRPVQ